MRSRDNTELETPEWVADAIFYQIFPDRFASSDRVRKPGHLEPWDAPPTRHGFKGGDLLGVLEHLDHLEALGADAIYFTPIFASASNHRYHTYDYYNVDPLLGGNEAFHELLEAAHRRGIRVILDGVFNHCGRGFWAFHHLLENGRRSPYVDWFTARVWPLNAYSVDEKPNYLAWWDLPPLPKLNVANPETREFLLDVAEHWVRFGIDGWRLDVPMEIDDADFWRDFRRRVRRANTDAYLVGEIWEEAPEWLEGDRFDGLMNYPFQRTAIGFCAAETLRPMRRSGTHLLPPLSAEEALAALSNQCSCYPPEVTRSQLNLLNSHDTARFLALAEGDVSALWLATFLQMTLPGAPCIYYGDEVGLTGEDDPDCRRGFPWQEERWDHETWRFFRRAVRLRRDHPLLRRGDFQPLAARGGVLAFLRRDEGRPREGSIVVILNAAKHSVKLELALPTGVIPSHAAELWAAEAPLSEISRGPTEASLVVEVPPRSGRAVRLD